jgi:hypothetical protein
VAALADLPLFGFPAFAEDAKPPGDFTFRPFSDAGVKRAPDIAEQAKEPADADEGFAVFRELMSYPICQQKPFNFF